MQLFENQKFNFQETLKLDLQSYARVIFKIVLNQSSGNLDRNRPYVCAAEHECVRHYFNWKQLGTSKIMFAEFISPAEWYKSPEKGC